MNAYSKMTPFPDSTNSPAMSGSTSKPATFSPPPPPPPAPPLSSQHVAQQQQPSLTDAEPRGGSLSSSSSSQFEEWSGVRKCGPVTLSRTCSSASQRFRGANERANNGSSSGIPTAMRRAFSLRRPSSLAEGYWRIHDTGDEDLQQDGDLVEEEQNHHHHHQHTKSASSGKKKKNKGRILKAWKKLFGF